MSEHPDYSKLAREQLEKVGGWTWGRMTKEQKDKCVQTIAAHLQEHPDDRLVSGPYGDDESYSFLWETPL